MSDIQGRGHYSGDVVCEGIEEGNISKVADLTVVVGEVLQKNILKARWIKQTQSMSLPPWVSTLFGKSSLLRTLFIQEALAGSIVTGF